MNIAELVEQSHATALEKGWWEPVKSFGELVALLHAEISEAVEEYRNNKPVEEVYFDELDFRDVPKPEGVPIELADLVIRVADLCGYYDIDLEQAIKLKMAYNKTRPYRHGGKKL